MTRIALALMTMDEFWGLPATDQLQELVFREVGRDADGRRSEPVTESGYRLSAQ